MTGLVVGRNTPEIIDGLAAFFGFEYSLPLQEVINRYFLLYGGAVMIDGLMIIDL